MSLTPTFFEPLTMSLTATKWHSTEIIAHCFFSLLVLPTLHITLHKDALCLNRLVDCCLAHRQLLRFSLVQFVWKVSKPLFKTLHLFHRFDLELGNLKKVYFQIVSQPMPACNIINSIHIVRTFLWEHLKVEQIDRNGRAQILILRPFAEGLIHPSPIVERPLLHIV